MGSLISYSGISTKVRAMERWRIRPEQFEAMAALESVPEAVRFLRSIPPYEEIFSGVEDKELHRGRIEQHSTGILPGCINLPTLSRGGFWICISCTMRSVS